MRSSSFFVFIELKKGKYEMFYAHNLSDFQKIFSSLFHQSTSEVAAIYDQEQH